MKTNVYITVDTESSMGGAWQNCELRPVPADRRIFCRINGRDHGIGWICDELDRFGYCATFFCEVLSSLALGERDSREYVEYLLGRGQDVQLHAHPNFLFYARYLRQRESGRRYDHSERSDCLAALPIEVQREVLGAASDVFLRLAGRRAMAYRAGGYGASSATLGALAEMGVRIDSSFNPRYQSEGSFRGETLHANAAQRVSGVWEIPVTVARQRMPRPGYRPCEVNALSAGEMAKLLAHAHQAGMGHVVVVFHSFSGVKARDAQYTALRPDRVARGRFRALLAHLAKHRDRFEVTTFGDLAGRLDELREEAAPPVLDFGLAGPLLRTAVQAINRPYWTL